MGSLDLISVPVGKRPSADGQSHMTERPTVPVHSASKSSDKSTNDQDQAAQEPVFLTETTDDLTRQPFEMADYLSMNQAADPPPKSESLSAEDEDVGSTVSPILSPLPPQASSPAAEPASSPSSPPNVQPESPPETAPGESSNKPASRTISRNSIPKSPPIQTET